jgi:excisionase family DNA binding protein
VDYATDNAQRKCPTCSGGRGNNSRLDGIQVIVALDPYLSIRQLAAYTSISTRKLREFMKAPARPLPHFRVGGRVLVRRSEFDAWMAAYRAQSAIHGADVDALVEDIVRSVRA